MADPGAINIFFSNWAIHLRPQALISFSVPFVRRLRKKHQSRRGIRHAYKMH